jgi:hypothetical protein
MSISTYSKPNIHQKGPEILGVNHDRYCHFLGLWLEIIFYHFLDYDGFCFVYVTYLCVCMCMCFVYVILCVYVCVRFLFSIILCFFFDVVFFLYKGNESVSMEGSSNSSPCKKPRRHIQQLLKWKFLMVYNFIDLTYDRNKGETV